MGNNSYLQIKHDRSNANFTSRRKRVLQEND